jgi:hypothetical protein
VTLVNIRAGQDSGFFFLQPTLPPEEGRTLARSRKALVVLAAIAALVAA